MTAKMTAKKRGRPRKYKSELCSTGCGAKYEPHRGSCGRCPRCTRLDVRALEPDDYPAGEPLRERAWDTFEVDEHDSSYADFQLKEAYELLYRHAPISAYMLAERIKFLERRMEKISELVQY